MTGKLAYSVPEAAEAVGVSREIINRAINAGDLIASKPRVNGREIAKRVILAADLEAWVRA